eukprot:6926170-Heterocapsa_arctica.AAC.1
MVFSSTIRRRLRAMPSFKSPLSMSFTPSSRVVVDGVGRSREHQDMRSSPRSKDEFWESFKQTCNFQK